MTHETKTIRLDHLVPPVDLDGTCVTYLDQNVWINLAQAASDENHEWRLAHDAVVSSAANGSAIFPLSQAHLVETTKRVDSGSRGRLIDFVASIWGGHAIRPWPTMLQPEARNAVRHILGESLLDLRPFVFGKGLGHLRGGAVPTLEAKTPKAQEIAAEILEQMVAATMGPESWLHMKDADHAAAMRAQMPDTDAFAAELQDAVDKDYRHPDKEIRKRLAEGRAMTGKVLDAIVHAMFERGVQNDPRSNAAFSTREKIQEVRGAMPTFHTFYELNHRRNATAKVKPGDLWDMSLSIAIPYCDVVATERSWTNFAKQAKLDSLYGTRVVSRPGDLLDALPA